MFGRKVWPGRTMAQVYVERRAKHIQICILSGAAAVVVGSPLKDRYRIWELSFLMGKTNFLSSIKENRKLSNSLARLGKNFTIPFQTNESSVFWE